MCRPERFARPHGGHIGDGVNDSPALSAANVGIAISDGAAIAREIADITIAADSLWELVELRRIAMALMARIHSNYRFVIGFNGTLIALGVAGVLPPATSATLHNLSTLGVSLRSMGRLTAQTQCVMHGKSNRRCAFFYTQRLAMANHKKKGEDCIRPYRSTIVLSVLLLILSGCSLFVGVIDLTPGELLAGNFEQLEIFLISRLPRLLAILCTGIGMSVAGLIMQQLCSNKFVSPTIGATISSAQFGILLALLFMPASTLWSRAIFAFATAILGTWIFVWFIQRIQFKDVVMVPLVGIMFGNVIGGITNYLAYKYEMTQALSSWLVGHFFAGAEGPV